MQTGVRLSSLHTPEQIGTEAEIILGDYGTPVVSLGHIERLARLGFSPLSGGDETDDLGRAFVVFGTAMDAEALERVREQCEAGFRALECIRPSKGSEDRERSVIPPFSPEWLADMLASGFAAMPSATAEWLLWECPWCLLCHMVGAMHRRFGGITARPEDSDEAKRLLDALNGVENGK